MNPVTNYLLSIGALLACGYLTACGSGSSSSAGGGTDNANHIVSQSAAKYSESSASNDTKGTADDTTYTLDTAGLIISGTFDAGSNAQDFFKIKRGAYNFLNVQVYVDGQKVTSASQNTTVTLDAVIADGYSTLLGSAYFNHAGFLPVDTAPQDWVISVFTTLNMGKAYTIEIVGSN